MSIHKNVKTIKPSPEKLSGLQGRTNPQGPNLAGLTPQALAHFCPLFCWSATERPADRAFRSSQSIAYLGRGRVTDSKTFNAGA